jgi:hypothetical protein
MGGPWTDAVDAKLTEKFLRLQPGVLEIECYWDEETLVADLVVSDDSNWSERMVRLLVAEELGLHQVPRRVLLSLSRLRAA